HNRKLCLGNCRKSHCRPQTYGRDYGAGYNCNCSKTGKLGLETRAQQAAGRAETTKRNRSCGYYSKEDSRVG
ncbi:hypothetical protein IW137_003097, partial [Coemansia sp. RSA 1287]